MAKSYLFHHTNKNSATPCVVHKKMLSLMASVCAFFASTKVVPVFHFATLQSKLYSPSLAQLAVGSRRYISPSFRFSSFWFISLAPHSRKNFAELIFPFRFSLAGSRLFFLFYFESYSCVKNTLFDSILLKSFFLNQTIYPMHTAS